MKSSCRLNTAVVSSFSLWLLVACIGLLLSFSTTPAWAQSATGTLSGQVNDPSSAAIGGAVVKLVDSETNASQTVTTNGAGRYTFANVAPGVYNITVSHSGFTQAKLQGQKVDIGLALTLNVTLQIGSTTTVVEVQAG